MTPQSPHPRACGWSSRVLRAATAGRPAAADMCRKPCDSNILCRNSQVLTKVNVHPFWVTGVVVSGNRRDAARHNGHTSFRPSQKEIAEQRLSPREAARVVTRLQINMWLLVKIAARTIGRSEDTVERRGIPWVDHHVSDRIRYKHQILDRGAQAISIIGQREREGPFSSSHRLSGAVRSARRDHIRAKQTKRRGDRCHNRLVCPGRMGSATRHRSLAYGHHIW